MDIFVIIAIGVIGALLSVTVRSYRPEYGVATAVATGVIIMFLITESILGVIEGLYDIVTRTGIDTKYFKIIIKVIAISYITRFSVEICRDAGENAIAQKVDAAGKFSVMLLTIPVISGFLDMIIGILSVL